jgi:hypothetical protein
MIRGTRAFARGALMTMLASRSRTFRTFDHPRTIRIAFYDLYDRK